MAARRGAYRAEKRQKEIKRLKKQAEKRARKLAGPGGESDETLAAAGEPALPAAEEGGEPQGPGNPPAATDPPV